MDAQLNDLIRLKQAPAAPVERWQRLPTRERLSRSTTMVPPCTNSPLRTRTPNLANMALKKTPEPSKFPVKYKHSPKVGLCKTPSKTPKRFHSSKTPVPSGKTPRARKSPPKSGKKKTPGRASPSGCRFIPNRTTTDLEYSSYLMQKSQTQGSREIEEGDDEEEGAGSPSKEEYQQSILKALNHSQSQKGVLSFTTTTPSIGEGSFLNYTASMSASFNGSSLRSSQRRTHQHRIPTGPERILDAPALLDDYYLNTLDWSRTNKLAIGLGNSVFLWNATDGSVQQLMELGSESDYVSSVSWAGNGKYLAIGGSDATIQLWDVEKERRIRVMKGHSDRVGVLTWSSHTLTSGCRDGAIHHHDVRKPEHCIGRGYGHCLEVCGLKWSADGKYLASGANDNLVCVWKAGSLHEPSHTLRGHQAAVKAVSWCPWQPNVLATGGGSSDKCVKLWNASTGQCTDSIDTKSQVSAISWNREYHEMITAHGQPLNQMTVWKFPSMAKVGEMCGHQGRILHMSLSPRKTTVASAGADETLRIWKCFERSKTLDHSKNHKEDSIVALLHSVR